MNIEFINPFIQGSQDVLNMICGEAPSLGKLFVKQDNCIFYSISISVEILGDVKGNVIYTMHEETACYIASKMMFGMPVPVLDEMSQSAICELSNMISGNVATIFSGKGRQVDIKPPVFTRDALVSNFPFIPKGEKLICVPLIFANGFTFELDLLLS